MQTPSLALHPLARARRLAAALAVLSPLLMTHSAVQAHHAFSAEFDADKPLELKGTVTKAKWVNPHSWLYFDVTDAQGKVTNWGVEFGAPFSLQRQGLTKQVLPPGTEVRIKGYAAKNGGPFGYAVTVTLPDGRVFKTGGAQDAPTANP